MKVRFVVLEPETKRGTYEVPLPIVVGRGSEAKFRIQQDRISRKHCEVLDRDGDVYLRDLGSTNGTFLNGEQIAASIRTPVPPGSVLKVGTIEIRIDYEGSGRLSPPSPSAPVAAENATMDFAAVEEAEPVEGFPAFDTGEPAEAAVAAEASLEEPPQDEPIPDEQAAEEPQEEPAVPTAFADTQKAPQAGDFGGIEADDPAIEAITAESFGAATDPEPVADGSFGFLAGSQEEQSADDPELGDFFKGLK